MKFNSFITGKAASSLGLPVVVPCKTSNEDVVELDDGGLDGLVLDPSSFAVSHTGSSSLGSVVTDGQTEPNIQQQSGLLKCTITLRPKNPGR